MPKKLYVSMQPTYNPTEILIQLFFNIYLFGLIGVDGGFGNPVVLGFVSFGIIVCLNC